MSSVHHQIQDSTIIVTPLTQRVGAEIKGVHLSGNLSPEIFKVIYDALLEHKVIFFRGQNHLNQVEQEQFATLFGKPLSHPTVPVASNSKHIFELNSKHGGRANVWHTDITFIDRYPKLSILRAVIVPETGGDTTWANTETAYEELPVPLQALAEALKGIHSNDFDYGGFTPNANQEALDKYKNVFASTIYEAEHPVVRVHPDTGRKSLVLGQFLKRFVGLTNKESNKVFEIFQDHVTRPENTVRWKWQVGDIAIWDNRATQHLAVNDYLDAHRVMHRVTVEGEVPLSVHGERSQQIKPYTQQQAPAA